MLHGLELKKKKQRNALETFGPDSIGQLIVAVPGDGIGTAVEAICGLESFKLSHDTNANTMLGNDVIAKNSNRVTIEK